MSDEPRNDDDDTAVPPDLTVPPWLRTGPTPDTPLPGTATPGREPQNDGPADDGRAASRAQEPPRDTPPNRITLGARRPSEPTAAPAIGTTSDSGTTPDPGMAPAPGNATPTGRADTGPEQEPVRPVADTTAGRREPDRLSTLRLDSSSSSDQASSAAAPAAQDPPGGRGVRIALLAAAGVAVLGGSAVLGYLVARGAVEPSPEAEAAGCVEVSESGRVAGSGPGSLDTPAETVLAFDHAYYVQRSAEKAFEAVAPSSRMTEEQLRDEGIEQLAEGTGHCVDVRELSPTLLEVELTEYPPEADPVLIRQRVRVEENPDGTWGIVSITPAG